MTDVIPAVMDVKPDSGKKIISEKAPDNRRTQDSYKQRKGIRAGGRINPARRRREAENEKVEKITGRGADSGNDNVNVYDDGICG